MDTDSNILEKGASEEVMENELPQDLHKLWLKSKDALNVNNHDYSISLLQAILKKEPCFLEGRKALRSGAARKKEGENKRFSIGGGSGGLGAMKIQPMVKKDPAAAIVALEKDVLAAEPYNPQGNQMLFEACSRANMPKTAGFALETLVAGNPDNTKYMHQLGDYYFEQGFNEEAGAVFEKISEKDPTDLEAASKGKNASARASMAKQNYSGSMKDNLRDANQAAELEKQSRSGMTRDQLDEQIGIFQAQYAENQEDLNVVKHLASLYEQKDDYENALT
ncbi:MAG: hypothetical protein AAF585_23100, partial [Verrucomicrobiota bacterium]